MRTAPRTAEPAWTARATEGPDGSAAPAGRARRPALFALSVLGGAAAGVLVSLAVPVPAHGADDGIGGEGGSAIRTAVPVPVPEGAGAGEGAGTDPGEGAPTAPGIDADVGPGLAPDVVPAAVSGDAPGVGPSPEAESVRVDADPVRAAGWARTVARVADSVVSLELSQLRAFDGTDQGISTATGFVVDAERGIVLTNRHVVGSGPIRVAATFQNQERVEAVPLYRDPIHDFAFVRYDPEALRYARPATLALRPDKVRTGMNIRVIGSDGGEQLSILPGTIARLDRKVPEYGRYGYNDFNTFYLQAASGTSGGSSGSPVIDLAGDVVALNAAANRNTASSFFLPLPRIAHALEGLRAGRPVARGGLQTLFEHRPFRELARFGLDADTEARVRTRDASTTGMLTVEQVIPGGVGDGALEVGDVLVTVAGEIVTDFIALEALLDASVGDVVALEVVRGGATLALDAAVADLHALAPKRFVELGDAVLQELSIQDARAMNLPARGVVVSDPGYFFTRAGVPRGAVVRTLAGRPVDGLDDFLAALERVPRDARTTVRFVVPGRERSEAAARLEVDGRWFGARECERVDDARFWRCDDVTLERSRADADADVDADAAVPGADGSAPSDGTDAAVVPTYRDPVLDRVAPALVKVDFHVPYPTDNVYARHFAGVGLVLDAERGLVVVDRNTVPVALGDAEITFFGATVVPAEVVHLHPRHNLALLRYDPAALGGAAFEALDLAPEGADAPADPLMIGYRDDGTLRVHRTGAPSRMTAGFAEPGLPRFQQAPLEVYGVRDAPPSLGGPIVGADGTVHALYMSFAHEGERQILQSEFAMPAHVIAETLRQYDDGEPYRSLDAHLGYRPLALARELGLPDAWLRRYLELDASERRALYVERVVPGAGLAAGDVLIAVDGRLVSDLFLAERLSQHPAVTLSVLRDGSVIELDIRPTAIPASGTDRVVSWAGALFQAPHPDIAWHKGIEMPGVYVADTVAGSPALWDSLWRNRFVTAVNGRPVADLDAFLAAVGEASGSTAVRLSTVSMDGRRDIAAVEPEYRFWPTFEVRRDVDGWHRVDASH